MFVAVGSAPNDAKTIGADVESAVAAFHKTSNLAQKFRGIVAHTVDAGGFGFWINAHNAIGGANDDCAVRHNDVAERAIIVDGDGIWQRTLDFACIDVIKINAAIRPYPNSIIDGIHCASTYETDVYGIGFIIDALHRLALTLVENGDAAAPRAKQKLMVANVCNATYRIVAQTVGNGKMTEIVAVGGFATQTALHASRPHSAVLVLIDCIDRPTRNRTITVGRILI